MILLLKIECGLPESLAATYRKFGHMGKLACSAIRVTKMAESRRYPPCFCKPCEPACRADPPVFFLCGQTFSRKWPDSRVIRIEGNCSHGRAKPAHFVGHLPILSCRLKKPGADRRTLRTKINSLHGQRVGYDSAECTAR